jgi:hypothetical protein
MRVGSLTPQIIRALKAQKGDWQVRLDIGNSSRIFQQACQCTIDLFLIADIATISNRGIKSRKRDRVLQAYWYTGKGSFQVDASIIYPFLSGGYQDLGETVGLLVGTQCCLAVGL